MNGDVTLASASTNTLTLNDHLVLVTGSNFTTPISGQQGYMITGTDLAASTSLTSNTAYNFSTVNLPYGVWMLMGQIGYTNIHASTTTVVTVKQVSINNVSATTTSKYLYRANYTSNLTTAIPNNNDSYSRIVTVTTSNEPYYLVGMLTWTGGTLVSSTATNFYAVRIA